jgi:Ca2+-binding RTX toxin-like protein
MATILGTNKNDVINTNTTPASTANADQISGDNGSDQIRGGDGNDEIHGDNADDQLWEGRGNDHLFGGRGNDTLDGGADNDTIDGGRGDDVMTGSSGADTFVLSKGNDRIIDFSPAESGSTQILIDFQDVYNPRIIEPLPEGYKGLTWDGGFTIWGEFTPPGGGFIGLGQSFSSPSQDFDFLGATFSVRTPLTLNIQAFDDGAQVGTATIRLESVITDYRAPPQTAIVDLENVTFSGADGGTFIGRFTSIDEVRFLPNLDFPFPIDGRIAVDDLRLAFDSASTEGDKIAVTSSTDVSALVASARSNDSGGTTLNTGSGTLTLEAINTELVSSDWFVVMP